MTKIVNLHKEHYDIYIGRGSIWGNPFKIGVDGNRTQVIRMYKEWIKTQPQLLQKLPELKDKSLGCFCKPNTCHGDILIELLNNYD